MISILTAKTSYINNIYQIKITIHLPYLLKHFCKLSFIYIFACLCWDQWGAFQTPFKTKTCLILYYKPNVLWNWDQFETTNSSIFQIPAEIIFVYFSFCFSDVCWTSIFYWRCLWFRLYCFIAYRNRNTSILKGNAIYQLKPNPFHF